MEIVFCEMKFICPKKWDDLTLTKNSLVRDCEDCGKAVHYVNDQASFEHAAENGLCVAFTQTAGKSPENAELPNSSDLSKQMSTPQVWRTVGMISRPIGKKVAAFMYPDIKDDG
jgi:hypothetical protein